MKLYSKVKKSSKGQSTIEFLVSFTIAISFIFSFLKLADVYVNGFYVHYATFMASRHYMVYESNKRDATLSDVESKNDVNAYFNSFNIPGLISSFGSSLEFEDASSNSGIQNLYVGVRVAFEQEITIPATNAKIPIPFVSESYLGKEPNRAECMRSICDEIGALTGTGDCVFHSTPEDNGC